MAALEAAAAGPRRALDHGIRLVVVTTGQLLVEILKDDDHEPDYR